AGDPGPGRVVPVPSPGVRAGSGQGRGRADPHGRGFEPRDSAEEAFALRDPMLMVGPPAAVKSSLIRELDSEKGIPYLAVTMHPGIGTFELVGAIVRARCGFTGTRR